jgi:probable F420-dependent oxidoreductase
MCDAVAQGADDDVGGGGVTAVNVGRVGIWAVSSGSWQGPAGAEAAAELDELGFGALWLGRSSGDLKLHTDLLGATRRLVVAAGIVNVWTEPSGPTAQAFAAASRAYPDRLLLGIGAGHKHMVERVTGQRYERPYSKVRSYLDDLDAAEPPVPPERRAVAALGPKMLALAGERSLGAHPYLVTPEHTRLAREILGPGPLLAPEQTVVLETDPDAARRAAREMLARYLMAPNYTNNWLRLGFTPDDLAGAGTDRLVDALVAWGDVETVLARVDEHHQAGADHVCVQVIGSPDGPPLADYRALAEALSLAGGDR